MVTSEKSSRLLQLTPVPDPGERLLVIPFPDYDFEMRLYNECAFTGAYRWQLISIIKDSLLLAGVGAGYVYFSAWDSLSWPSLSYLLELFHLQL